MCNDAGTWKGAQKEVDHRQPQAPVGRLPDRDAPQVGGLVGEDPEAEPDALPEADQILGEPKQQEKQQREEDAEDDQGPPDVPEEPVEVEGVQMCEHGAAG